MTSSGMHYASKAYARIAREVAAPRDLEARLLLTAAALLQAVRDAWKDKPNGLAEALLYNRRLWLVFIDAVSSDDNKLPREVRQNVLNLAVFVMGETYSLMTNPKPIHAANIIRINRALAAGLSARPNSPASKNPAYEGGPSPVAEEGFAKTFPTPATAPSPANRRAASRRA